MKTEIDSNQRVFLIHREGFFDRDYFCNLKDIPNIIQNELAVNDSYTISEYWNKKFKRISKKMINEMLLSN